MVIQTRQQRTMILRRHHLVASPYTSALRRTPACLKSQNLPYIPPPQTIQSLINHPPTLPILPIQIVHPRHPLLLRRQRSRFLLTQGILFLPQALDAAALLAVVGEQWWGGRAEDEGLVFDAVGEEILGGGGGVGAGEEEVRWMGGCGCHH